MTESNTKKCPFCAEEIKATAIKCKHCESMLDKPEAAVAASSEGGTSESKSESKNNSREFNPGSEKSVCHNCGSETQPTQAMCANCGVALGPLAQATADSPVAMVSYRKDKVVAGLLAIILGAFGAHQFYLGSWGWGLVYLCFWWTYIPVIVGLIEGIHYLVMSKDNFDLKYNFAPTRPWKWSWGEEAKIFAGQMTENISRGQKTSKTLSFSCSTCGAKFSIMEMNTKSGICAACMLKQAGVLTRSDESIYFSQGASYREGLADYPQEAKHPGFLYVCQDHLYFKDRTMTWKVAWEQVKDVQLENFKMSGTRAVLAGVNAMALQNVKNYLAVRYLDEEQTEWTVKFHIHGALSIPGEQVKAVEFLGYTNRFRPRFGKEQKKAPGAPVEEDIPTRLGKLTKLKEQGLITQEEFEEKKKELLALL